MPACRAKRDKGACASNQNDRLEAILSCLDRYQKVRIKQLAQQFAVSSVTIRNDLQMLAKQGLIIKTHGGALPAGEALGTEIPYVRKCYQNASQKRVIGMAAARLIVDNDVIILDSGSTTLEIAKHIRSSNVTVITNDIKIAMALANKKNIHLFVTGGELAESLYTLLGEQCIQLLRSVNVNKAFLGCDAFDVREGISNRTLNEIYVKRAMIDASEKSYVVFDQSKLHKKVFGRMSSVDGIDCVLTDELDAETRQGLLEKKIEVIEAMIQKTENKEDDKIEP